MKLTCSVMKKPGPDGLCETITYTFHAKEIAQLAVAQAINDGHLASADEAYDWQMEKIEL